MKVSISKFKPRIGLAALCLVLFGASTWAQDQALERMAAPEFDEFYIASSFKLPLSRKIVIADAPIEFSKEWKKDFQGRVDSRYEETVIDKYGETLEEQLASVLSDAGWQVEEKADSDTLLLKPRMHHLNIYAPNASSLKQVIVGNVGRAIVELDFQTPDGESFMKIVDLRETQPTVGSPIVANRTNNLRYFKMLMADWAEDATKYLNQVMVVVESQSKTE